MTQELTRVPRAATLLAAPGRSGGRPSKHDTPEEGHVSKRTVIRTACAVAAAAFLIACGAGTTPEAKPSDSPTLGIVSQGPVTSLDTSPAAPAPKPSPTKAAAATFGDGVWQIPGEVKPGTYRTVVPADSWNCYYAIMKDFSGDIRSIIDNGNQEPGLPQVITIPKTAKGIEVSGCGTWTKIK